LSLSELFEANRGHPWHFVRAGEDWIDHLIDAGANALGQRLGRELRPSNFNTFDPAAGTAGAPIYQHGSGGFNSLGGGRPLSKRRRG
jgi:hypothetical protein